MCVCMIFLLSFFCVVFFVTTWPVQTGFGLHFSFGTFSFAVLIVAVCMFAQFSAHAYIYIYIFITTTYHLLPPNPNPYPSQDTEVTSVIRRALTLLYVSCVKRLNPLASQSNAPRTVPLHCVLPKYLDKPVYLSKTMLEMSSHYPKDVSLRV